MLNSVVDSEVEKKEVKNECIWERACLGKGDARSDVEGVELNDWLTFSEWSGWEKREENKCREENEWRKPTHFPHFPKVS